MYSVTGSFTELPIFSFFLIELNPCMKWEGFLDFYSSLIFFSIACTISSWIKMCMSAFSYSIFSFNASVFFIHVLLSNANLSNLSRSYSFISLWAANFCASFLSSASTVFICCESYWLIDSNYSLETKLSRVEDDESYVC